MADRPSITTNRSPSSSKSTWSQVGSLATRSSIARAAIEQDIEDTVEGSIDTERNANSEQGDDSLTPIVSRQDATANLMVGSHRHDSYIAGMNAPPFTGSISQHTEREYLTQQECAEAIREERNLLRDNQIIASQQRRDSTASDRITGILSRSRSRSQMRRESSIPEDASANETSPLLGSNGDPEQPYDGSDGEIIARKWEEAVVDGKIQTSYSREAKVLFRFSRPLMVTFILQWSLTQASVFTVGHIGKTELGAVSLGSMTASITGIAVFQGLATSLDTLCAQAYGSGHKTLVGLQMQRMICFLWCISIPIAIIWASAGRILKVIIPDKEVAELAGLYLKILIAGIPGYAAFESGKRFVQAQGMFQVNMYCLLICAPLNALMHYLFVWQFKLGFIGAPLAVVITENLLPLCLFLYVYFIAGRECWGGLSRAALRNWIPMVQLAIPGLAMVLAEFLAFEILTLCAGLLSTEALGAQAVVGSVATLTFFLTPFPISIAASTRIANLIGASLSDAAKMSTKVVMIAATAVGLANAVVMMALQSQLPRLFTNDEGVIARAARVLPVVAAFQLFDSLAANCNGVLRGLGKQSIGGYVNVGSYYIVSFKLQGDVRPSRTDVLKIAIPLSLAMCFGLHWDLSGLWAGPALGLALVSGIEGWFIYRANWEGAVEAARIRNDQG
ncbi:MAG: hypothetical protein M1820_000976 [Bogoriella megaspora]|nr:MAG: hypothetical protein M1820_000976 [Bogoriella megaspora]